MGCACDKMEVRRITLGQRPYRASFVVIHNEQVHLIDTTWQILKQDIANIGVVTFVRLVSRQYSIATDKALFEQKLLILFLQLHIRSISSRRF